MGSENVPMTDERVQYECSGKSIPYEELDLERPWEAFDLQHELTRKGIRNLLLIIVQHSPDLHKGD
jgi:hypothetical protein